MKRATLTPNRFITFTPNWWVKAFVLFTFFFILDGCVDETSLTGFKKEPRMEVKFKEFLLPAVTIQADSVYSQNIAPTNSNDRLLAGVIENPGDPNFGKISASIFAQFLPSSGKISKTNKTSFQITKLTLNMVMDFYVYGDTLLTPSTFSLHEITDPSFNVNREYFTNTSVAYDPTPLSTGTYNFNTFHFRTDSIKKFQSLNNASDGAANDVYDSLTFDIPVTSHFAKALFDTLLGKGIYYKTKINNKDTVVYNSYRTDSAFLKVFKGIAIKPVSGNRVLGFSTLTSGRSLKGISRLTLDYTYDEAGVVKPGKVYYFFQSDFSTGQAPSFTQITSDRTGSGLSGLPVESKYTEYNSPDNYCYVQSGTGVFTKLDLRAVRDTLDLLEKVAINSAELIIPIEPNTIRQHWRQPNGLMLRTTKENSRFFIPPQIPQFSSSGSPFVGPDPIFASSYYCIPNDKYLDVRSDDNDYTSLELKQDDSGQYYKAYLTEYFQYHTQLPSSVSRINFLAVVPFNKIYLNATNTLDVGFGKSLDGISFRADQIKLRVFYSVPK